MGVVKRTPDPCFTSLQASFDYFCSALSLPMRLCHVDLFTQPSVVQRHAGVLGEMGWLGSWERENETGHESVHTQNQAGEAELSTSIQGQIQDLGPQLFPQVQR